MRCISSRSPSRRVRYSELLKKKARANRRRKRWRHGVWDGKQSRSCKRNGACVTNLKIVVPILRSCHGEQEVDQVIDDPPTNSSFCSSAMLETKEAMASSILTWSSPFSAMHLSMVRRARMHMAYSFASSGMLERVRVLC
jgi:hypothetical protein